jgi:hypothetical protein
MTIKTGHEAVKTGQQQQEKILLVLLPFWEPLIPPIGISCLKSYLTGHGYQVKTVDSNVVDQFGVLYKKYFDTLKSYLPQDKWGNFYNIGKDLLRNHLMAHINYTDETEYIQLVKELVFQTFFSEANETQVRNLNEILTVFITTLETYIHSLLKAENPTVLGLSVYRGNVPASLFAFRITRKYYPHIRTVMGGGVFADQLAVGSPDLEFFLAQTKEYIDALIIGEGEILFHKYLSGEFPADKRLYTLGDIDNVTLDISTVDTPDFSDFELQHYPSLALYASRSCPFQCSFCSETLQWGNYRKKKVARVVQDAVQLYRQHGFQLFLMSDSLLNPVIMDFANELLKTDVSIYWDGYLRIDNHTCDIDTTLLWRQAGFYRARLGVESGSPKVLNLMDKRITVEQTRQAVSSLARAGIKTTTYWLVGYPGETEDDFQQTLDLIEYLKDDIYEAWCNLYWYYPGGQVKSGDLAEESVLLYPEKAKDMLIIQTRVITGEPSKEVMVQRLFRFIDHCQRLGVPTIYSMHDINKADERWQRLHKNATPPLVKFISRDAYITENRDIKKISFAQNTLTQKLDFDF